jgi:hypothetical protein
MSPNGSLPPYFLNQPHHPEDSPEDEPQDWDAEHHADKTAEHARNNSEGPSDQPPEYTATGQKYWGDEIDDSATLLLLFGH